LANYHSRAVECSAVVRRVAPVVAGSTPINGTPGECGNVLQHTRRRALQLCWLEHGAMAPGRRPLSSPNSAPAVADAAPQMGLCRERAAAPGPGCRVGPAPTPELEGSREPTRGRCARGEECSAWWQIFKDVFHRVQELLK